MLCWLCYVGWFCLGFVLGLLVWFGLFLFFLGLKPKLWGSQDISHRCLVKIVFVMQWWPQLFVHFYYCFCLLMGSGLIVGDWCGGIDCLADLMHDCGGWPGWKHLALYQLVPAVFFSGTGNCWLPWYQVQPLEFTMEYVKNCYSHDDGSWFGSMWKSRSRSHGEPVLRRHHHLDWWLGMEDDVLWIVHTIGIWSYNYHIFIWWRVQHPTPLKCNVYISI